MFPAWQRWSLWIATPMDLSAEALNQIFKDLPQGKTFEDKYGNTKQSTINIYGNPGKDTCDKSIAEKKGWKIY